MRVALLIHRYAATGGAEGACRGLARGLASRGHEVHVFARSFDDEESITPRRVPVGPFFKRASYAAHVARMLERESFDIVHSFTRTPRQDVLRLGGGTHVEYLAQTGGISPWRALKERAELRLERESFAPGAYRKIVAVSKRVKEEVIRHYPVPAEAVEVVYNGVDGERFRPDPDARAQVRLELGVDGYLALFCGTGFKRKGLEYAVAALDRVPGARLLVVGEGTPVPHARATYLGVRRDLPRIYAAADVLIHPTLYDPFPNVCLEAMASGLPVIVSRIAGVSEILDADSIVVEDPTRIHDLATALMALQDPSVRRAMGEAARAKALRFTPDRVVEDNLRIYESIRRERAH